MIFKIGEKVRYIDLDLATYEYGKVYETIRYNKDLDLYGLMSEYLLPEDVLEEDK